MKIINRLSVFLDTIKNTVCLTGQGEALDIDEAFDMLISQIEQLRNRGSSIYLIGNGGSAGIASHMAIDLINMSKVKAHTLFDLSMLTCISNDHGYEEVFKFPLEVMINEGDILIAISSSGESENILNAVKLASSKDIYTITLSGFLKSNSLKKIGNMNIWLDSTNYGVIEIGHAFLLHNLADRLAEKHLS